jgi:hypothetical protein
LIVQKLLGVEFGIVIVTEPEQAALQPVPVVLTEIFVPLLPLQGPFVQLVIP